MKPVPYLLYFANVAFKFEICYPMYMNLVSLQFSVYSPTSQFFFFFFDIFICFHFLSKYYYHKFGPKVEIRNSDVYIKQLHLSTLTVFLKSPALKTGLDAIWHLHMSSFSAISHTPTLAHSLDLVHFLIPLVSH